MTRAERIATLALLMAVIWAAWDYTRIGTDAPELGPPPRVRRARIPTDPEGYRAIVESDLFLPARHAEFGTGLRAGTAAGHALRGIVSGASGTIALFEPLAGGPPLRLRVGESIGGARIVAIGEATVTLDRAGRRRTLAIDSASVPAAARPTDTPPEPVATPVSPPPVDRPTPREPTPDEL